MTDCMGVMGRIFGHKFVGRYDETSVFPKELLVGGVNVESTGSPTALKDTTTTYCGDVCMRCGLAVNEPPMVPPDLGYDDTLHGWRVPLRSGGVLQITREWVEAVAEEHPEWTDKA